MMRISTVTMFEQSMTSMNRQQSEFLRVGQQIASGRRVVTPADDPQDASRAVRVSQAQTATQQNTDSRVSARNALSQTESVLSSSTNTVIRAKTLLVQAASETLNDSDRQSIASELRGLYETLIGQANSTDGNNHYLFGGYKDEAPPFVRNTDDPGIARIDYRGDEQVREQRVDAERLMPVTDNGKMLFQNVSGGTNYVARAEKEDAGAIDLGTQSGYVRNQGTVTFGGPNRIDASDPNFGEAFTIEFSQQVIDASGLLSDGDVTLSDGDLTGFGAGPGGLDVGDLILALEDTDEILEVDDISAASDGSELVVTFAQGVPSDFTFALESDNHTSTFTSAIQITALRSSDDTELLGPQDFQSGEVLNFGGISVRLEGEPIAGDQIQLRPADDEAANQDLFKTLKDAIDVLELDREGSPETRAHITNTINTAMRELDNSLDNILTQRASVGARLNELDLIDTVSTNRMLNFDQVMSNLVDLDYGEAVTEYSLRQVGLQAAQRAFVDIQGMSLFDFMR
jgi:flagellin-like hook-associated protein FlgL